MADTKDEARGEAAPNPEDLRAGGGGDPNDQIVVIDGIRYRKDEKEQVEAARKRSAETKKSAPSANKARSAPNKED